jgi:hypothetical protein
MQLVKRMTKKTLGIDEMSCVEDPQFINQFFEIRRDTSFIEIHSSPFPPFGPWRMSTMRLIVVLQGMIPIALPEHKLHRKSPTLRSGG